MSRCDAETTTPKILSDVLHWKKKGDKYFADELDDNKNQMKPKFFIDADLSGNGAITVIQSKTIKC